jgi:conjugative relaxase-like TrwC/TraI family protein
MMSMHKLMAGDGYTYLTRHVAAGDAGLGHADSLVAYYEATGNPPGRWLGRGLAGLGDAASVRLRPSAPVTEPAMAAVFRDGHDPLTAAPLGRSYRDRANRAVVGYDLTFTVPKSASVLWALGDDATRTAVDAAHRAAVDQALTFVERTVARTRVGHAGCRQVRTRGVIAAAFDHWDSRTGDPNLHTHVVVANKVQGPDGVWRSLDGTTVHAATVTVSALYDSLLADELARCLPVRWSHRSRGERRNPAFELEGIDDVVLAAFSTRAEQIHCAEQQWAADFVASHGRSPSRVETSRARQHLTRATRPAKVVRPLRDLLAEWANRARALTGVEPLDLATRALTGTYARGLRAHDVGTEVRAAVVAAVLDDVAKRRSVWTTWNLGAAAARATLPLRMASPAERLRLLNEITTETAARCVHLDDTRDPDRVRVGEALYTSVELLAAEKSLIDASEAPGAAVIDARLIDNPRYRAHHQLARLAPDQRAAVRAVLASGRRLDAFVGPAGSGKTTTLAALAELWTENLGPVIGLAPSATAARALEASLASRARRRPSGSTRPSATAPTHAAAPTGRWRRGSRRAVGTGGATTTPSPCAGRRTGGRSHRASSSSSTKPHSPTRGASQSSSARRRRRARRSCWSGTTSSGGPSTRAARSACSPAADRRRSSPPCAGSGTRGRRERACSCGAGGRPRSTPTPLTARSSAGRASRCSMPRSVSTWLPARRDGWPCSRPPTTGRCASSTRWRVPTASDRVPCERAVSSCTTAWWPASVIGS